MTTIYADELQPGHVVEYHGTLHRITRVERGEGWAWPVAFDGSGWAIALGHDPIDVLQIGRRDSRRHRGRPWPMAEGQKTCIDAG